jgi:5-methyltetrahydrofolate--homocysteine methyltransferase
VTAAAPFLVHARDGGLRLDGAMATFIHTWEAGQAAAASCDRLSLSRPDLVTAVHHAYLEAGADIVRTNSFRTTSRAHAGDARDVCRAAARLARVAADDWSRRTPDRPRFVAGTLGPPDAHISRDDARTAYRDAMRALCDGRVDFLLIETCYAPAHVTAALTACADVAADAGRAIPVFLSLALDAAGRLVVSGARIEDAIGAADSTIVAGLGINCGRGPDGLETHLAALRGHAAIVTCHPSAGLPDASGRYAVEPDEFARQVGAYAARGRADIVGGCCGTTPAHIAALARAGRQ